MTKEYFIKQTKVVKSFRALIKLTIVLSFISTVGYFTYSFYTETRGKKEIIKQLIANNIEIENGKAVMNSPVFQGYDNKNLPYEIKAAKGTEVKNGVYDFNDLDAVFHAENSEVHLTSEQGTMDKNNSTLKLEGDVHFVDQKGYTLKTKKLLVNYKTKAAHTKTGAELSGEMGTVKSQNLDVAEDMESIKFSGERVETELKR